MAQQRIRGPRQWLLLLVGLTLLAAGVTAEFAASKRQGHDYACVYLTSAGLLGGDPIYDYGWQKDAFPRLCGVAAPQGMFYPPATGLSTLPLAFLPYPAAHTLWFVLMTAVLVFGVRELVKWLRPSEGAHEWMIVSGLVLLSACIRWGMTAQQGAPLILGLLAWFVVALQRGKLWLSFAIAAFAIAFKTTLALPFAGLLFLHRQYLGLGAALGSWVLLNVVGFARLGGLAALHAYQHNVSHLEAVNDINTPDPWVLASVPRLDWVYLFDGLIRSEPVARLAALAFGGAVGLWLAWQAIRVSMPVSVATTAAFLLPFACLTNLVVYHHHYDVSIVLAPLLVFALGPRHLRQPTWAVCLFAPLLLMITLFPVAKLQTVILAQFGLVGRGLLNLSFPLSVTLTLIGAVVVLHRCVGSAIQNARASAATTAVASGDTASLSRSE